jgi:hypothetical protein
MFGVVRNSCKIVAGKPEGKRSLGRPCCRWENNSKIDPKELEYEVWTGFK